MAKKKSRKPKQEAPQTDGAARTLAPRPSQENLARPDFEAERPRARAIALAPDKPLFTWPLVLRKFCELSVFAAFLGAILTYNLMVPLDVANWFRDLATSLNGGSPPTGKLGGPGGDTLLGTMVGDLEPFLMGGMPVLESKAAVFTALALFALVVFTVVRVLESTTGLTILPSKVRDPNAPRVQWTRLIPLLGAGGFLLWAFVSISPWGWSPSPPEEALAGVDLSGAGGGYHAFVAWIQLAAALLYYFVAEDILRTRRTVYKVLALILLAGLVSSLVAVLAKIGFPIVADFWMKFPTSEYRNDVGSFIGHNAALSSFLMAPILIGYALLRSHWDRYPQWVRVFFVASLVVGSLALVLAQSRAVIPIIIVLFVVLVWMLYKRTGLKAGPGLMIGGPLLAVVLIASQLINAPWNPLYRETMPLEQRIEALGPDHLRSETRLRILLSSLPVVASSPITGTGWNSFQYVFPVAQGEFYAANPETTIVPTNKRTQKAHNEYLQVLMETGAVGLVLALVPIVVILAGGWQTLRASINQRHMAIQVAIWVSLWASLFHFAVDFQPRVPPSAVSFLLLLAIWSAGERFWIVRLGSGELTSSIAVEAETPRIRQRRRPIIAGCAAAMFVCLGLLSVVCARASDWITAGICQVTGRQMSEVAQRGPQGIDLNALGRAEAYFLNAQRLAPLMGSVYYDLGRTSGLRFLGLERIRQQLAREGNELGERARRAEMMTVLRRGIESLERALIDFRFHGVYSNRANLKMLASQVSPPEDAAEWREGAIEDMRQAVAMNPGDWKALETFISWLRDDSPAGNEEIAALEKVMYNLHEWYYFRRFVPDVNVLESAYAYQLAVQRARDFVEIDPDNDFFQLLLARTLASAGELDQAEALLSEVPPETQPLTHLEASVRIAARRGEFDRAVQLAESWDDSPDDPWQRFYFDTMAAVIQSRMQGDSQQTAIERIRSFERRNPNLITAHAQMLLFLFSDPAAALEALERREATASQAPLVVGDHMLFVIALTELRKGEIAALMQEQARAREAGEEAPRAEGDLRRDLQRALDHARAASRLAISPLEDRAIDPTIRSLETLLNP